MTTFDTSRRTLLKGVLAAAAAAPIASAEALQFKKGMKWDRSTDVLVIGYGGAGAAAAMAAQKAGAKVLLIEKMAKGGGTTSVAGGGFIIPKNADDAFQYLSKTYDFAACERDDTLLRTFCKGAVELKEYFRSLSPAIEIHQIGAANYPALPHADTIEKYGVVGKGFCGGANLFAALEKCVNDRKIPVLFSTPAKQLIRRGDEVIGAVALHNGKEIRIRASKGVVLATGGYEYDKETLQNYAQGTDIGGLGNPGNTGDGLRMAMTMGSKLWHMTSYSCPLGMRVPGLTSLVAFGPIGGSWIVVNQDGKRFVNEKGVDFHAWYYSVNQLNTVENRYPAIPAYVIFDEKVRHAGPIGYTMFGYATVKEGYYWSPDSSKEVASGVVKKADTIEELAGIIHVPADKLKATVDTWNTGMAVGKDPEFGRPQKVNTHVKSNSFSNDSGITISAPLSKTGPYYAAALYPALLNTQGGPRRLPNAQLMTADNKPIGRLFSAGELGSMWGSIYQGSSNIAECLVFGQIAGKSAAQLKA